MFTVGKILPSTITCYREIFWEIVNKHSKMYFDLIFETEITVTFSNQHLDQLALSENAEARHQKILHYAEGSDNCKQYFCTESF